MHSKPLHDGRKNEQPHRLPFIWGVLAVMAALAASERAEERVAAAAGTAPISVTPGRANRPVSLRDRLVVGLQARLPSEVAFVELTVLLVQTGQVPQRLVDETFFWARQRAAHPKHLRPRRPIIYFQPAMTARLRRLDIDI